MDAYLDMHLAQLRYPSLILVARDSVSAATHVRGFVGPPTLGSALQALYEQYALKWRICMVLHALDHGRSSSYHSLPDAQFCEVAWYYSLEDDVFRHAQLVGLRIPVLMQQDLRRPSKHSARLALPARSYSAGFSWSWGHGRTSAFRSFPLH